MHAGNYTEQLLSHMLMLISRERTKKEESLQHLIKVSNDLVQQPQAFHSHIVTIQLDVEIIEVRD